jgi:hypothetical protein
VLEKDLNESPGATPRIEARPADGGQAMLDRALNRARLSILWERLWPALASIATAFGLFLVLSWLGLWLWLPPVGRAIGLGVFCLIGAAALLPLLRLRLPSPEPGCRRDRAPALVSRWPARARVGRGAAVAHHRCGCRAVVGSAAGDSRVRADSDDGRRGLPPPVGRQNGRTPNSPRPRCRRNYGRCISMGRS